MNKTFGTYTRTEKENHQFVSSIINPFKKFNVEYFKFPSYCIRY